MKRATPAWVVVLRWLLAAGVGAFTALLLPLVLTGPLEPARDAVVEGVNASRVQVGVWSQAQDVIDVQPVGTAVTAVAVVYPGGLVASEAYTFLAVMLAAEGVRTLIPRMPLGLAVLQPGRAGTLFEALTAAHPGVPRIILGHSLGGAMAASFVRRNPTAVDALVLMGAYTAAADDLRDWRGRVLVLAAEHDGLSTVAEIDAGMVRLPVAAERVQVDGAVHAYFGRYGPQDGDGTPTVTRETAEWQLRVTLRDWLASWLPARNRAP